MLTQLNDLEKAKFYENDDGDIVVRTSAYGSFRINGLISGGMISAVELNDSAWTQLPPTALSGRNAMSIQNDSGKDILLNYSISAPFTVGIKIPDGGERQYDIADSIPLYGVCSSGTCLIIVEELA